MIEAGQFVLVQGRYFGTVRQLVAVQNEHGYSVAYLVQYQREVNPSYGWFLARDVVERAKQPTLVWCRPEDRGLAWQVINATAWVA